MNYYTEVYYTMQARCAYLDGSEKIVEDRVYSDQDIKAFLEQDIQECCERPEQGYTREEAERAVTGDYKRRLENVVPYSYPKWVLEQTDNRLLAICRIPRTIWERLRKEQFYNCKIYEEKKQLANKVLREHWHRLPESVQKIFRHVDGEHYLDEACLIGMKRDKTQIELDYVLGIWSREENKSPYIRIAYKNAEIVACELSFRDIQKKPCVYNGESWWSSNIMFVNEELYLLDDKRIEYHVLLQQDFDRKNIVIRCETITCKELPVPFEKE